MRGLFCAALGVLVFFLQVCGLFFMKKIYSAICPAKEASPRSLCGDMFCEPETDAEELKMIKIMENIDSFGTNKVQEDIN